MRRPILITAFGALAVMAWLTSGWQGWTGGTLFRGQKADYYNLLVDGFQEGHLYMKADVHPGRLSPDVQVRMRSPYLMDASEYHGRHYLYFGVVPAALVFWPYAAITGHDLHENIVVLLGVVGGFFFSLLLYAAARTRYFPSLPGWADILCTLLLAFAPCTPALLVAGSMYEVAIAYGYLGTCAMLYCAYRALHADRGAHFWLAAASLFFGLSVGCRPTLALLGPLVALAGLWVLPQSAGLRPIIRLGAAVVLPAALIGLGLMAYNYARFGNPLEFGLTYQINALTGTGKPLHSLAFIPFNLGWYYLSSPVISPYFPYVFPLDTSDAPANYFGWEPIHGQWLVTLLAIGTLLGGLLSVRITRRSLPKSLRQFLILSVLAFAIMVLVTSTFGIRSNRYMVDFQAALIMAVVLWGAWQLSVGQRGWWSLVRGGACLIAALSVLFNVCLALQLLEIFKNQRTETYRQLAYQGNKPAAWLARSGLLAYGPLRMTVVFTRPTRPVYEPLLATGTPNYKDILFAAQYPGGHVDFVVYHEDHGGARSALLPIEYDRPYTIEVDMGSLYPPKDADYFPGWGAAPREILKSFTRVALDGVEVIRTRQGAHDSPPGRVEFGRASGRAVPGFSGRISQIERLPPRDDAALRMFEEPGVWRFEIGIPDEGAHPILGAGTTGAGNLLFLRVEESSFRFGLDIWGFGAALSPALPRDSGTIHVVEVFVGSQVARHFGPASPDLDPQALAAAATRLNVWLDGRLVWSTPLLANQDSYGLVNKGTNTQGFSTAGSQYGGVLRPRSIPPDEIRTFIEKNLHPSP